MQEGQVVLVGFLLVLSVPALTTFCLAMNRLARSRSRNRTYYSLSAGLSALAVTVIAGLALSASGVIALPEVAAEISAGLSFILSMSAFAVWLSIRAACTSNPSASAYWDGTLPAHGTFISRRDFSADVAHEAPQEQPRRFFSSQRQQAVFTSRRTKNFGDTQARAS